MPKILINEEDYTSPGAPGSYANYAVLVTGFTGRTPITDEDVKAAKVDDPDSTLKADKIQPDSNGVYEFTSAQVFKDIIGLRSPEITNENQRPIYHYGNQVAYELLNMGYTVVYKPIQSVDELVDETFWEDFKDKSSYDFRFITHGLLESSPMSKAEKAALEETVDALDAVNEAIRKLEAIQEKAELEHKQHETDPQYEIASLCQEEYLKIVNDYEGFKINIIVTKNKVDIKLMENPYEDFTTATTALMQGTDSQPSVQEALESKKGQLISGGVTTAMINQVNLNIANLAKYSNSESEGTKIPGRGDCIALIELDEAKYSDTTATEKPEELIIDAIGEIKNIDKANGTYCAMTVPSVHYKMAITEEEPNEFNNNVKFPGAFHYLACFMNSLRQGFAEWYAAAGYTRGVASYTIDYTTVKLGEIAINTLEPRNYIDDPQIKHPAFACNVIAYFRGSYYLWGNRTALPIGRKGNSENGDLVASSFLNIRQLCITIKKQLYVACRTFTFDPNSDTLWVNFVNAIRPTLEEMKADQGIRDYKILKVVEKNPKKATLKAKIRIIPIEAVEDFDLEVSLEDSFGETAAVVTE